MEITLSPAEQARAERKVANDEYASLSELISVALRPLLEEPPMVGDDAQPHELYADTEWTIAEINQKIAEADASHERGAYVTLNRETGKVYFEKMIARLNAEFDAKQADGK